MSPGRRTTDEGAGASLWRTVKTVAWGFFGVRRDGAWREDAGKLSPLQVVAVGLAAAVIFVVGLVVLVNQVASA